MERIMKATVGAIAAGVAVAAASATSHAQQYPTKPIRMLVGFSAGSATDITARLVSARMTEALGQTIVVDNRAGAAGSIATELVVRAPADGYTLLMLGATEAILPVIRKLPYDIRTDLAPVSTVSNGPQVLVVNLTVAARTTQEFLALARANPGKIRYGTAGVASSSHLAGSLFNLLGKVNVTPVPYKGATEMAVGTAANEVEMSFPSAAAAIPLVDSGKVRALGVTSTKRVTAMPNVPTLAEGGLTGYDRSNWYGVLAPKGTPPAVVDRLHGLIDRIVRSDEMKAALIRQGLEPDTCKPEVFAQRIRDDVKMSADLIRLAGVKPGDQ